MKKYIIFFVLPIILIVITIIYYKSLVISEVENFDQCVNAQYPVLESFPRQCRTPDGRSFIEEVSDNKSDLIIVSNIKQGDFIQSPLTISGEARGPWFFEASFPVKLFDANGTEIALGIAQAKSEWMTNNFVPWSTNLVFATPTTKEGLLVFEKDNPSGLPEFDDSLIIPVSFVKDEISSCLISGCSSQICSDQDVVTTCEFNEEYACYAKARCERKLDGQCGWTKTVEFNSCISNIKK